MREALGDAAFTDEEVEYWCQIKGVNDTTKRSILVQPVILRKRIICGLEDKWEIKEYNDKSQMASCYIGDVRVEFYSKISSEAVAFLTAEATKA